jgi:hypothetical protein
MALVEQAPGTAEGVGNRVDAAHEDEALVRSLVRPRALPDWDLSPRMTAASALHLQQSQRVPYNRICAFT